VPDETTIPGEEADEGKADQATANFGVVKIKLIPAQDADLHNGDRTRVGLMPGL